MESGRGVEFYSNRPALSCPALSFPHMPSKDSGSSKPAISGSLSLLPFSSPRRLHSTTTERAGKGRKQDSEKRYFSSPSIADLSAHGKPEPCRGEGGAKGEEMESGGEDGRK